MEIDRSEVLRYLGYGGNEANEAVHSLVEECCSELIGAVTPRCTSLICPVYFSNGDTVTIGTLPFHSHDLSQHLSRCCEAALFAATLGSQVDHLIRRYSLLDMSKAVVFQACAAALVEAYCDECESPLREYAAQKRLFLRPRYSPGYGDFSIEYQKSFIDALDCPKKIGLTVTESSMLAPSKSVTAVIGMTSESKSCHTAHCMQCSKENCPFRKE